MSTSLFQILSFNEISDLDGLAGLNRLRHLDVGYNVIEGVQRHLGNSHYTTKSKHTAATTVTIIPTTIRKAADINELAATKCTTPGPSFNVPTTSELPVRVAMEKAGDAFSGKFSPLAAGSESGSAAALDVQTVTLLPSLTRLDLNNNILHNLDDLKVRGAGFSLELLEFVFRTPQFVVNIPPTSFRC